MRGRVLFGVAAVLLIAAAYAAYHVYSRQLVTVSFPPRPYVQRWSGYEADAVRHADGRIGIFIGWLCSKRVWTGPPPPVSFHPESWSNNPVVYGVRDLPAGLTGDSTFRQWAKEFGREAAYLKTGYALEDQVAVPMVQLRIEDQQITGCTGVSSFRDRRFQKGLYNKDGKPQFELCQITFEDPIPLFNCHLAMCNAQGDPVDVTKQSQLIEQPLDLVTMSQTASQFVVDDDYPYYLLTSDDDWVLPLFRLFSLEFIPQDGKGYLIFTNPFFKADGATAADVSGTNDADS